MKTSFARAGLLTAALFLAGCNGTLEDIAPSSGGAKAHKPLPEKIVQTIRAKGMQTTSPVMIRIFKEESTLEVWKQKTNGRYDLVTSYDICKWSGKLGPKFTEGDRQAPEGFYTVRPHQMNPQSQYHLAFNIGYPNAYDSVHGRTGKHLMVHGACSSAGCYSMTDPQIEQIYAFGRDAFRGGQTEFQIQAFPFRMTAANMARYKDDPNYEFWSMLKEGYDHFEITKVPPKVDVCGGRYVFNQMTADGKPFSPGAACPAMVQPQSLQVAYKSYKANYDAAFTAAVGVAMRGTPAPSIAGPSEATLVAEWSRRRARGERVTREPPTIERPEILVAERRPAAAPVPVAPATVASIPTPAAAARVEQASVPVPQAVEAASGTPGETAGEAQAEAVAAEQPKPGLRSRLLGMFGN